MLNFVIFVLSLGSATFSKPRVNALVIVDMQECFLPPRGEFQVDGAQNIIPTIRELKNSNIFQCIIVVREAHPQKFSSHRNRFAPTHVVRFDLGADVPDELGIKGTSYYEVVKNNIDFDGAADQYITTSLQAAGVTHAYFTGVGVEYSIQLEIQETRNLGIDVTLITDASVAVNPTRAEREMVPRLVHYFQVHFKKAFSVLHDLMTLTNEGSQSAAGPSQLGPPPADFQQLDQQMEQMQLEPQLPLQQLEQMQVAPTQEAPPTLYRQQAERPEETFIGSSGFDSGVGTSSLVCGIFLFCLVLISICITRLYSTNIGDETRLMDTLI